MFVTTTLAFLFYLLGRYPFPLFHPVKMLGNVSGLAFLVGWAIVLAERLGSRKDMPKTTYADGLFLGVIALAVVTGFLCQAARFANAPVTAYSLYFVHLLFVFFLLVYLPYSKFAHLLYRTVAMIYARGSGRQTARQTTAESKANPETPDDAAMPADAA